jgi:hypothetical protein
VPTTSPSWRAPWGPRGSTRSRGCAPSR